jgi:hypothetical protein
MKVLVIYIYIFFNVEIKNWKYGSVVEHLPNICEVVGLISSTAKTQKTIEVYTYKIYPSKVYNSVIFHIFTKLCNNTST